MEQYKNTETSPRKGWQRLVLLTVLGYESIGALIGGSLLIARRDGSYMDMPVAIMHGAFSDFLIPGIIQALLGLLNSLAFMDLFDHKRAAKRSVWLALAGMTVWFTVETIILEQLHWLHAMWGLPVVLGWMAYFAKRSHTIKED